MFSHVFERKQPTALPAVVANSRGARIPRYSGAWAVLRKRLLSEPGLRILDIGYTSPTNINYLTGLGHSLYLADIVHDAWVENWQMGNDEDGNPIWNVDGFLKHALDFSGRSFDIVLLWTALDYLPDPLVKPVVDRLSESVKSGGEVLALFHTRLQGDETAHCRFHLTEGNDVEVQRAESFPIRRAFTNRSIEKLFSQWAGHRQFLAKDSVSEVIMKR